MKKAKRFLTGLLSAALALSLCAMPAMAAEGSGTTPPPSANPVWTQDTGSITIHKYEWNGTHGDPATGREDKDQLPSEKDGENTKTPNPLAGAEFTIYQVKDANWLSKYYSGAATVQEEEEYKTAFDAAQYYTEKNGTYTLNGNYTKYGPKKTDANGKVQFGKATDTEAGIPLGLYLVIETKTPDQVTTPCQPFLVSVPMTVKENDKTSSYVPTEWLYDVHVYPKNKTDYGNITLIKKGQVGNDKANTSLLPGVTFKLYKFVGTKGTDGKISPFTTTNYTDELNDTTMAWKQIKKSSTAAGDNTGAEIGPDGLLTTSNVGKITVSGLSAGYYCFVEQGVGNNKAFITDQTPHYFEVKGKTSQEITVTNDGIVTEKAGSTALANLELTVTDPRPDVEKKVKDRAPAKDGDEYVKASDYSVGDNVPYKVTVKVPEVLLTATPKENEADNFVFEVTDTPENLKNNQDVKVYTSANEEYNGAGVNISYDAPENGFTAKFTQAALQALVGKKTDGSYNDTFTITYTAKLLKGADMTVNGNKNTINLKYSNKIDADGKINPGTSSEIEDGAVVYTFSIHVDKRGEKNDGDPLPGVKFNVYKKVAEGTLDAVKGSTIGITGEDKDNWFVKVVIDDKKNDDTKYDLVTGLDGKAQVDGLANGTYYLVETATVNGYNLLSGPVKVTIQVSYFKSWTAKDDYVDDKLVHHKETQYEEYFGGKEDAPGNGYILTTIINRKGFNLPTTGGFGTLLFSGIGVLLVVAGVGVLLSLKKKNRA